MKKYNTPELTISSFDVEDIITNGSGVYGTGMETYAEYTSANGESAKTIYDTGAYFAWDAH